MIGRVYSGKVLLLIIIFNILFFVNYIKILPVIATVAISAAGVYLACSRLILARILRIYIFILFLVIYLLRKNLALIYQSKFYKVIPKLYSHQNMT